MEELVTYKQLADNDYDHFMFNYEAGRTDYRMGAEAQEICEKYLKHLLDNIWLPDNSAEQKEKAATLHCHSLHKLLNACSEVNIDIPDETADRIGLADGYYFTTRYPSPEWFAVTKRDLDKCVTAMKTAKELVEQIELDYSEFFSETDDEEPEETESEWQLN